MTKVWSEVAADSAGDFVFESGERYAVLASVSLDYTLDQVRAYVENHGFAVTYAWEWGQPNRATYRIDQWIAQLPEDANAHHRWIYAEGNFTGSAPFTVGQHAPWPLTVYEINNVFEAVDAPAGDVVELPPKPCNCPPKPGFPWGAVIAGVVSFGVGLKLGFVLGARPGL